MALTPEAKVKAKVRRLLEAASVYYFMPATGGYGKSGVFDIVCAVNGLFIGIETKATCKAKPTALQSYNAALAKASGCAVLLIHNDNTHLVAETLTRIANDPTYRHNPTCVWPFDGVEEGSFRLAESVGV